MSFSRIHTALVHSQALPAWFALFGGFGVCAFQAGATTPDLIEPPRVVAAAPEHPAIPPQLLPVPDLAPAAQSEPVRVKSESIPAKQTATSGTDVEPPEGTAAKDAARAAAARKALESIGYDPDTAQPLKHVRKHRRR